ncbi:PhnD/SsuA/transferrin family substrate-binding protein [Roseovarius sp.]|uniref:substrate-binding domain-containing protein n=1 Tax=Roseovarius sp. TaxID=1486281 RepID=UPI00356A5FA6
MPPALCGAAAVAQVPFRLGLTPVFLDNDAIVIDQIRMTLRMAMDRPIELVQRRTYEEITGLLLEGGIDAAWLCGYPFLKHRAALSLIAVPVWRDRPLYRSYLIAGANDPATGLRDLEGGLHAFSDPNSNSGWLVTASDLARIGRTPDDFFRRTVFTYGHRNVVRAVARGLTRSGSVDGYVWEVLSQEEPELASHTRIVARSEWLGFPPLVCRADRFATSEMEALSAALLNMDRSPQGQAMLRTLHLDGFAPPDLSLFDGVEARMHDLVSLR